MRVFGGVTRADLLNEVRAIIKLCDNKTNKYIVEVRRHGQLPGFATCYFIDMEYCSENLETHIDAMSSSQDDANTILPTKQRILEALRIVQDIAQGLAFIHELGEVHRDLKPRNGIAHFLLIFYT